jgi:hypothetical protein
MNAQNLIDLSFAEAQLANIRGATATLNTELAGLISLSAADKQRLRRMGSLSEDFCRQALETIALRPEMVPANIPVAAALADLKVLDQLRPVLAELTLIQNRVSDSVAALGHDIMTVALRAYGLMKLTGQGEGMESLRRDLKAARFKGGTRIAAKTRRGGNAPPDAGSTLP